MSDAATHATNKLLTPTAETLTALANIVGAQHALRDPGRMAPYLTEWRDRYRGEAAIVLKPGSTDEVEDAVLAKSSKQTRELWQLREVMSEVQKREGDSIKHDASIPIGRGPEFIDRANELVELIIPGARPVPFGHLEDGNIHYNVSQPVGMDKDVYLSNWEALNAAVHEIVLDLGGSISAEHGIGRMKRELLPHAKGAVAMELMRLIKTSFDPNGILNPGKLL